MQNQIMIEDSQLPIKLSWYKKWWGKLLLFILILIVIALLIFGFLVYRSFASVYNSQAKVGQSDAPYSMDKIIDPSDPYFGSPIAPIVIVEFGDFLCQVSQRNYSVIRQLQLKYPDQVRFYWRNFPIIDEASVAYAQAGECAHLQGKFWPFHDRLFQLQDKVTPADLLQIAIQTGLNEFHFTQCMTEQRNQQKILADVSLAEELEVVGTPTFFVNGYKLAGYVSIETWEDIINSIAK
ncbi:hypothetical protein A2533_03905 [Candidatus Falkowbacteria bacterium RIFOXYD2_FULL_35_9]|uniref:Thioredoxin domain-containing protein n=1 Tax=Candidatus Falkowbacteria bacterium RIFOXYC2_FULL_36_12 TaxID=1798002 RepID=A0A1F5T3J6_9BACT|nr:MAG: hypothetical protein A2300_01225 [Candidatus Falkowbacteria bacterium RIFOXYB2_FULL_35_7]OGF33306.1 MAG: hypothetical protein A2478_01205 [Candidatus Falkowbacteria bacterium RIFOXYC2_FULL_36_12]OGF34856.1 MAG: hypothetical protein A2223_00340 [Candidatus Falkowbacteria bacterium RIFOXYA2_FULL_35_8]OGF48571.1 MAG: hypothetical protein A2533_03905 [Candidatus Falkowbacteria bacterium RIFOXYD2_FULL_35_9]